MGSIFHILTLVTSPQGWEAVADRSWVFLAHWLEPEPKPLEKKTGAGASWKKSQEPEPLKN